MPSDSTSAPRRSAVRATTSAPSATGGQPDSTAGRRRSPRRTFRVGLLVERRYMAQAQPAGLVQALRSRGHDVTVLDPQSDVFDVGDHRWLSGLDLLVARGRSSELLCRLSGAEARGVPTVNRRASIAGVHNKAEMGARLSAAGVPTPRTVLASGERLAAESWERFPIVLKPVFGDNGRGIRIVHDRAELERIEWPESVALAQEYVAGDGYEWKLYGIGEDVWAVRRPYLLTAGGSAAARPPRGELMPLLPSERDLALRCRRVFGLELYGLDCIRSRNGTVVLEVNEYPNYTGVPAASERLADYVLRRIREAVDRRAAP